MAKKDGARMWTCTQCDRKTAKWLLVGDTYEPRCLAHRRGAAVSDDIGQICRSLAKHLADVLPRAEDEVLNVVIQNTIETLLALGARRPGAA